MSIILTMDDFMITDSADKILNSIIYYLRSNCAVILNFKSFITDTKMDGVWFENYKLLIQYIIQVFTVTVLKSKITFYGLPESIKAYTVRYMRSLQETTEEKITDWDNPDYLYILGANHIIKAGG